MDRVIHASSIYLLMMLCSSDKQVVQLLWSNFWEKANCYEDLPEECKPVLPWVAAKLDSLGISYGSASLPSDLTLAQLLGKRRHAWATKGVNRFYAGRWSDLLARHSIPHCFIKGIACLAYDPIATSGRPASDVDVFIDESLWDSALTCLVGSGDFVSCQSPSATTLGGRQVNIHAITLTGETCDLDLHRHPIPGFMDELAPFDFKKPFLSHGGLPVPGLVDHLAISTLHAFCYSNLLDYSFLKYLADVLPLLSDLGADEMRLFSEQVSRHQSDTEALSQTLELFRSIQANLELLSASLG